MNTDGDVGFLVLLISTFFWINIITDVAGEEAGHEVTD